MPVIQISRIQHRMGTSGELPDALADGELGFTTDTGEVFIGASTFEKVAGRKSYPYQNIKLLTEFDVQYTMTGDVYHAGPLYSQDLVTTLGVMDVPLFAYDSNITARYGSYDFSFTSTNASFIGEVKVALNGTDVYVTSSGKAWGDILDDTFVFSGLLVNDRVILRASWDPADITGDIFQYQMAGREWNTYVPTSAPPAPPALPTPEQIMDLSAAAIDTVSVQLTFTDVANALSYEYRINAGAPQSLAGTRVVAGLTPAQSYNFEVRGINAHGNGPWSNVATVQLAAVITSTVDSYTVTEGQELAVNAPGVLTNDSNAQSLPMSATIVSYPAHGTIAFQSNGGFTYRAFTGYTGLDTFTYRATDGTNYGSVTTVNITVEEHIAAVTVADAYTVTAGTAFTVPAPGVLANDTPGEGPYNSASLVTNPSKGTLTLNVDGSFTYTANINEQGTDSFTYRVYDGVLMSDPATVTFTIDPYVVPNGPPTAFDDSYSVDQGNTLTVSAPGVLVNDIDPEGQPMTALLVTGPSNGTLVLNSNGSFTYTPNNGFFGTDTFQYRAMDPLPSSLPATVTITVNEITQNFAPVANDDTFVVNEDETLTVAAGGLMLNDTDQNGDPLTASLVSQASNGTVVVNANGSFTYTPNSNYNGPDSFTYKVNDGEFDSNVATVNITVTSVLDADSFSGISNRTLANNNTLASNTGVIWQISPDGKVKSGTSTTANNVLEEWLLNAGEPAPVNPGAYKIMATTTGNTTNYTGMALGQWHTLDQTRFMRIVNTTNVSTLVNFSVDIRRVSDNALVDSATISLWVDTSTGGGGGGGGCVWTEAYLSSGFHAGSAKVGSPITVLSDDGYDYLDYSVQNVDFVPQPCATITTESGIELTCSYSTPITIRQEDGKLNTIFLIDSVGHEVPVLDHGEFRWEPIAKLEDVGVKNVAIINVNDGVYAAGNNDDRYVFTHNTLTNDVVKH